MKDKKSLVPVVAIGAALMVGYFLWVGYAKTKVREVVEASLARIEEKLESNGDDATVTYKDVAVQGFSLRPTASVRQIDIVVKDKRGSREMAVSIPQIIYMPKNVSMSTYRLEVLDAVTINNKSTGKPAENVIVTFNRPPALDVNKQADGNVVYAAGVPENITFTKTPVTGETETPEKAADAKPSKIDVVFAKTPVVEWKEAADGTPVEQKARFQEVSINYEDGAFASFDALTLDGKHRLEPTGEHMLDSQVKLENLNFTPEELHVLNPVSIVNDISYTGPLDMKKPGEQNDTKMHWNVRNVAWMSGLVSFFANGEVYLEQKDEKLPYGNLTLRFDDVEKLFDYIEAQRPQAAGYMVKVREAIEKLSGTVIGDGTSISIPLTREPKGHLQVGKLTLEETLALFIGLFMQMSEIPQAPVEGTEVPAVEGEQRPGADASGNMTPAEDAANGAKETPAEAEKATQAPVKEKPVEIKVHSNTDDVSVEVVKPEDKKPQAEKPAAVPAQ